MKIQILSDLHLEGGTTKRLREFKPKGDVLVLCGDICTPRCVNSVVEHFDHIGVPVLYVPGNHEFYRGSWPETEVNYREVFKNTNIKYMNLDTCEISGITFIGATLWSNPSYSDEKDVERFVADFSLIENFSVETMRTLNIQAKEYLAWEMTKARLLGKKTVVMTHFPPSWKAQEPRFKGSALSSYFYNDMENLIEQEKPNLWIYGHTHGNVKFDVGGVPVVCNQLGYNGEITNKTFDYDYVVEV